MGADQSKEQAAGGTTAGGYRVFNVIEGSPAHAAGLEVFFDYIVAVKGVQVTADQQAFFMAIKESENQHLEMSVFSLKTRMLREVLLTPHQWGGAGLLGATIKHDTFTTQEDDLMKNIRVLEVFPDGPAAKAGLHGGEDFILGIDKSFFRGFDAFLRHFQAVPDGKSVSIIVYNSTRETVRNVDIVPDTNWGGKGKMGCEFGSGMFHRIPFPKDMLAYDPPKIYATAQDKEMGKNIEIGATPLPVEHDEPNRQTLIQNVAVPPMPEKSFEEGAENYERGKTIIHPPPTRPTAQGAASSPQFAPQKSLTGGNIVSDEAHKKVSIGLADMMRPPTLSPKHLGGSGSQPSSPSGRKAPPALITEGLSSDNLGANNVNNKQESKTASAKGSPSTKTLDEMAAPPVNEALKRLTPGSGGRTNGPTPLSREGSSKNSALNVEEDPSVLADPFNHPQSPQNRSPTSQQGITPTSVVPSSRRGSTGTDNLFGVSAATKNVPPSTTGMSPLVAVAAARNDVFQEQQGGEQPRSVKSSQGVDDFLRSLETQTTTPQARVITPTARATEATHQANGGNNSVHIPIQRAGDSMSSPDQSNSDRDLGGASVHGLIGVPGTLGNGPRPAMGTSDRPGMIVEQQPMSSAP